MSAPHRVWRGGEPGKGSLTRNGRTESGGGGEARPSRSPGPRRRPPPPGPADRGRPPPEEARAFRSARAVTGRGRGASGARFEAGRRRAGWKAGRRALRGAGSPSPTRPTSSRSGSWRRCTARWRLAASGSSRAPRAR